MLFLIQVTSSPWITAPSGRGSLMSISLSMHAGPWKEPSGERLFPRHFKLYLMVLGPSPVLVSVAQHHFC